MQKDLTQIVFSYAISSPSQQRGEIEYRVECTGFCEQTTEFTKVCESKLKMYLPLQLCMHKAVTRH